MSSLGNEEATTLGRTFGEKFKQLFEGKMDLIDYTITSKEVTQQSFHAFHKSLNETILADAPMPIPTVDDERLRFYSKCKKYRTYSDKSNVEYDAFVGGTKMRTVVDKIKKLLGVKNLKTEQVITMHQICAFELGIFNQSDWCSFFTLDDLIVLDYLFDLSHFWQRGFGYQINWQMSCPFTRHMLKRFDDIIAYQIETTVADIQFAHSYTLLPVYTAFGLFKDSNTLLANNFEANKSRRFRVSNSDAYFHRYFFLTQVCEVEKYQVSGEVEKYQRENEKLKKTVTELSAELKLVKEKLSDAEDGLEAAARLHQQLDKCDQIIAALKEEAWETSLRNAVQFKKLRVLDLSCNYIDRIENLSENVDIRELKMYGNRIHQLENLYSLKELSNLQLQHNKIKTIGELILFVNYLPNLEELNASNNRLRTVDFNRCKKLQDIDLSGNDLKDINGLKGMGNLQILNVSNNRITTIKQVGKLRSKLLTELYAADNHISELSYIPTSFPVLEILNISRNNVASFEEVCSLNSLEELSELFISGNPFSNDEDGIHISYMSDIQAEFSNLDILDGAHLKRAAHRGAPLMRPMTALNMWQVLTIISHLSSYLYIYSNAPLMRPMTASTIITVRQVETQMKQMDSDMKSIENDFMERMEQLKSTLDKLPSQPSDSSRSPKNNVSQSIHFTKTSSHSRIRDALKFAAEGLDSTEN
ncbi:PPP1R7 [Mytilus edulis]|uniref:PPP1R7 n=1 Tax=Mytilus edulis TaxID=6550 RepID=A0A8S3RGG5_MYTED|nr:PPP1R7 [Mytilus edulis]